MALPDGTQSLNKGDEKYILALEKMVKAQQADINKLKQQVATALRIQR